jgi:DNA-nicking Smr family endonuclease
VKKPHVPRHEAAEADKSFREAVGDVRPIRPQNRVEPFRLRAQPLPVQRLEDEREVLRELARQTFDLLDDIEIDDDGVHLRAGLPREILRKLRRTHWSIQDELDLHGMTADQAAEATAGFIAESRRRGLRCVRIIHGKGLRSPGREPVLKRRIRRLLVRRDDVLAFVEPRAAHGGGGAVVVLLEGSA